MNNKMNILFKYLTEIVNGIQFWYQLLYWLKLLDIFKDFIWFKYIDLSLKTINQPYHLFSSGSTPPCGATKLEKMADICFQYTQEWSLELEQLLIFSLP